MSFALLMGVLTFGPMAVTVAVSGINSGTQSNKIRKQITEANNNTDKLQSMWNDAIKKQTELTAEEESEITDLLDQMAQLAAETRVTKRAFSDEYNKIQMAGVSFVITIFFLLLLKWTGILDVIEELILSPFKKNKK